MKEFLTDATLLLSKADPLHHVVDHNEPLRSVWSRCKHTLQVCSYLFKDLLIKEDETLLIGITKPLEVASGERMKKDREGKPAHVLGLEIRIEWATGRWLERGDFQFAMNAPRETLLAWSVLRQRDGEEIVDSAQNRSRERVARCYACVTVHTFATWRSGVYQAAALLHETASVANAAAQRLRALAVRLIKFEEKLAGMSVFVDQKVVAFERAYLFKDHDVYRDLLFSMLESGGRITPLIKDQARQIHESESNEKPLEDAFKYMRRAVKKVSENNTISADRLLTSLRTAMNCTYPNAEYTQVESGDWERLHELAKAGRTTELCNAVPTAVRAGKLDDAAFLVAQHSVKWLPKRAVGQKTCAHTGYSGQAGLEECLLKLVVDQQGQVADWSPITRSWITALLPDAYGQLPTDTPVVVLERSTGRRGVVLTSLAKRCVVLHPLLEQPGPHGRELIWEPSPASLWFFVVTDYKDTSDHQVLQVEVAHDTQCRGCYRIVEETTWGPLRFAATRGFVHVTDQIMAWLCEGLGVGVNLAKAAQVEAILDLFAKQWELSDEKKAAYLALCEAQTERRKRKRADEKACEDDEGGKVAREAPPVADPELPLHQPAPPTDSESEPEQHAVARVEGMF